MSQGRPGRLLAATVLTTAILCIDHAGFVPDIAADLPAPMPAPDAGTGSTAAAEPRSRVRYQPPVDAAVIDGFRMDNGTYGAGNRGLEYGTVGGEQVRATADGEVSFAGMVAGRLVVSVVHADGRISSLTHMRSIAVRVGQFVGAGSVIGAAESGLHFGVRENGHYLDPATLFDTTAERRGGGVAYLVEP